MSDDAQRRGTLTEADLDLRRLFWHEQRTTEATCPRCSQSSKVELTLGFDWRDRDTLREVSAQYPSFECSHCGAAIENPLPVVEFRPGDPVRLLIMLPKSRQANADHLTETLKSFASPNGTIEGPLTALPYEVALDLLDRYSGFLVSSIDDGTITSADLSSWAQQFIAEVKPPDVLTSLGRILSENDPNGATRLLHQVAEVLNERWRPVRLRAYQTLRSAVSDGDRSVLDNRIRRIDQFVILGGDHPDDQADLPLELRRAIDAAVDVDAHADGENRRALLLGALSELRRNPQPLLLVGALASTVAVLIESPSRTPADLTLAIDLSAELIESGDSTLGRDHRIMRQARNDRAVAAMELPDCDREQVMADLVELCRQCIEHEDPLLSDVVLNLAVVFSEATTTPTADEQRRCISLFRSSLHLLHLHAPDDVSTKARTLNNLAAALRRAPLRAQPDHQTEALAAYQEAISIDDAHRVFAPAARFQLEFNLTNTEIETRIASPTPESVSQVPSLLDDMYERTSTLFALSHPARIRTVSTLAALAVECYDASLQIGAADLRLLDRAIKWVQLHSEVENITADIWLALLNTLGVACARPVPSGGVYQAAQALEAFNVVLAHSSLPENAGQRRDTGRNLGQFHIGRGDWAAAGVAYGVATQAANVMIRRATTVTGRIDEIERAADLCLLQSLCLLQTGEVAGAIEALEAGRQRLILADELPADLSPVFADDAIVVWIFTCTLASALIAVRNGTVGTVHVEALSSRRVAPVVERLTRSSNQPAADEALAELDALLSPLLGPLREFLARSPTGPINIVAAGTLARVPIHALAHPGAPALVEAATVRFMPTALAAARLRTRPPRVGRRVVVADPEGGLDGARAEAAVVRAHHADVIEPPQGVSIRPWLEDVLPQASVLHLACHATVGANVYSTFFQLGDPRTLTLADLLEADFPNLDTVVAAACSTAATLGSAPDELLGLGYGMLAAGAAEVIASLWDIDDFVTALIVARMYHTWETESLAASLADAQRWCSGVTNDDLAKLVRRPAIWLPHDLVQLLRRELIGPRFRDPAERPFASSAFWGGLIYVGR